MNHSCWLGPLAVLGVVGCATQPRSMVLTRHIAVPVSSSASAPVAMAELATEAPLAAQSSELVPTADCSNVDTEQQPLGDHAYVLDGLGLQPGSRLPDAALPNELFRIPLEWPASPRGSLAIGFEQPGDAAGILFASRGCVLNTWFFSFGGNGVELGDVDSFAVTERQGRHWLVTVRATGRFRGALMLSEEEQAPNEYARSLVFAVDEQRAALVFDTEGEQGTPDLAISLARAGGSNVLLRMGEGLEQSRFRYDVATREFVKRP